MLLGAVALLLFGGGTAVIVYVLGVIAYWQLTDYPAAPIGKTREGNTND